MLEAVAGNATSVARVTGAVQEYALGNPDCLDTDRDRAAAAENGLFTWPAGKGPGSTLASLLFCVPSFRLGLWVRTLLYSAQGGV